MSEVFESNKDLWDKWTPAHAKSEIYDVESFKKGACSLQPPELKYLGDVKGKTMLHLQCHFGMDTLSWARRGAIVTGADISTESIKLAKKLSKEIKVSAKFIESNVYDLPNKLKDKFDIVFCSYGVVNWLPDMNEWAKVINHFLKPGGTFYMIDFHPILKCFDESIGDYKIVHPYFHNPEPQKVLLFKSYAEKTTKGAVAHVFQHHLSEIFTALLDQGLLLSEFEEFDHSIRKLPNTKRVSKFHWVFEDERKIPFMYSVKFKKPE